MFSWCRCFLQAFGIVQIALANFVGLLVEILLKLMRELSKNFFLAASVRKNVKCTLFEVFVTLTSLHWSWILRFPFADHKSCSLEMSALPTISNNPSATFCGQKCLEVISYSDCEFFPFCGVLHIKIKPLKDIFSYTCQRIFFERPNLLCSSLHACSNV